MDIDSDHLYIQESTCPQAIFIRGYSDNFLEYAAQMMRIVEAKFVCNLTDCLVCFCQQFLYPSDYCKLDIFLCGLACLLFDKVSEIIGRKAYLIRTILDGWQTFGFGFA